MNILPGMLVKVLAPFDTAFPDTYTVDSVDPGTTTAHLSGIPEGMADAFDFQYLEVVA